MIEEFVLNGGAVTTGSFIAYLIYQARIERTDKNEDRRIRIAEKNQFIEALAGIKEELIHLKIFNTKK